MWGCSESASLRVAVARGGVGVVEFCICLAIVRWLGGGGSMLHLGGFLVGPILFNPRGAGVGVGVSVGAALGKF